MHKLNIFKKFICFLLLYTIFISNSSTFYVFAEETTINTQVTDEDLNQTENNLSDPLELVAQSAVLIDAKTGVVIYDKNKDQKSFPASTTKVLTALLTIENTQKTDILTHSHNAVFNIEPGSSHIGMRENEQITIEQALHGVLLASANEVCMALAEHISGSVDEFVKLMNERAKEIGAKNTNFVNPHGFHNENHYTTSYDMALIMKEAIKNEDFINYISTPTYKIPKTNIVDEERILNNSNKLILKTSPYYYEYCVGGKTGFTNEAGNTLVTYAKKDNIELIAVVMKDEGFKVYDDTKKLFEYGFSCYEEKEILVKDTYKNKASVVQNFKDQKIPLGDVYLTPKANVSAYLPNTIDLAKVEKVENIPNPATAPINIGDKVGTLDFVYEGNVITSVDLVSEDKIDIIDEKKLETKEKLKSLLKITLTILKYALIAVIAFFVILFTSAFIVRNIIKYRRAKRRRYRYGTKKLKPMKKNNRR